jgi:sugar/nucleoside kinase (ribokinase family)
MLGNLDPTVQFSVIDQLEEKPSLIVLDTMNFWMDIAMDNLKKVISKVDVLMINDDEARQLTGHKTLPLAAAAVHEMGPKTVVIKKGEHGAIMFEEGQTFFSPAMPLEKVIDPTGAGDAYRAGFYAGLSRRRGLDECGWLGAAAASFAIEVRGPVGKLPVWNDVLGRSGLD